MLALWCLLRICGFQILNSCLTHVNTCLLRHCLVWANWSHLCSVAEHAAWFLRQKKSPPVAPSRSTPLTGRCWYSWVQLLVSDTQLRGLLGPLPHAGRAHTRPAPRCHVCHALGDSAPVLRDRGAAPSVASPRCSGFTLYCVCSLWHCSSFRTRSHRSWFCRTRSGGSFSPLRAAMAPPGCAASRSLATPHVVTHEAADWPGWCSSDRFSCRLLLAAELKPLVLIGGGGRTRRV